jgi:hypothetical protein
MEILGQVSVEINNAAKETASLLESVPGGRDLLKWFSGSPNFGDAEIISLNLDRKGPSTLVIEVQHPSRRLISFVLGDWIDVRITGFSQQNVIGGLALKRAGEREIAPWEVGVGATLGDIEIELQPCFGASGVICATLLRVTF